MITPLRRTGVITLAVGLSAAAACLPAFAEDITPRAGTTPVVGMAYQTGGDSLWLAGPQADDGVIVEASSGTEVTFSGQPESVQALAWRNDRLWVGDIGDAEASRDYIVVFRLANTSGGQSSYNAFDFEYEDGPRDAKAMMVSGRGRIYIATAGEDPAIYRAPLDPARDRVNTLVRVTEAPEGVTDGAFLSDGSTMALRTATGIEYVDAFTWESLVTETIVGAPADESITVGSNDEIFVGGNPVIREAEVPSSDATTTLAPSPTPSPSPTTVESSPAPATAPAEPAPEDGPARTGTLVALTLAAVLALGAGIVTYFVRS